MSPLISVVMPVYNTVAHVDAAIDSVLAQTLDDFEFIIVEDGSDDGTRERVAARASEDSRIRVIQLERDAMSIGPARARNIGNAAARGSYIATMDADDVAKPHRLAVSYAYLCAHNLDAVGGQIDFIGGGGMPHWFPEQGASIAAEMVFRIPLMQATKFTRAAVMKAIPYVSPSIYEDYGWLVDADEAGVRLGNVPDILVSRRLWEGQNTTLRAQAARRDIRRFRLRYLTRHFPGLSARDFAVIDKVANRMPLTDDDELRIAADWIVRLSQHDDPMLHARMHRRWTEACEGAIVPVDADWRADIARQIGPLCNVV